MYRCCPETCGVSAPASKSACDALGSAGRCPSRSLVYTTVQARSVKDSDTCIAASTLASSYASCTSCTCVSQMNFCNGDYAKDAQRCCPLSCHVAPPASQSECTALGGSGICPLRSLVYTAIPSDLGNIEDDDTCLAASTLAVNHASCRTSCTCVFKMNFCNGAYANDAQRCCPKSCHVVPPR